MTPSERVYQFLLRAYPGGFRTAYGREMQLAFREQHRDFAGGATRFWTRTVLDVAHSAPRLRMDALRLRIGTITLTEEGSTMKMTMGILAIMVGALEAMNAMQEVAGSGLLNHDTRSLLAGTVALVAGALIVAAGIALLRRSPNAAALAQGASITCAAVFAFLALVLPLMSGFATLLGIAFPIALFAFARWDRGRGGPAPIIA
jgi:hypothetical protein